MIRKSAPVFRARTGLVPARGAVAMLTRTRGRNFRKTRGAIALQLAALTSGTMAPSCARFARHICASRRHRLTDALSPPCAAHRRRGWGATPTRGRRLASARPQAGWQRLCSFHRESRARERVTYFSTSVLSVIRPFVATGSTRSLTLGG